MALWALYFKNAWWVWVLDTKEQINAKVRGMWVETLKQVTQRDLFASLNLTDLKEDEYKKRPLLKKSLEEYKVTLGKEIDQLFTKLNIFGNGQDLADFFELTNDGIKLKAIQEIELIKQKAQKAIENRNVIYWERKTDKKWTLDALVKQLDDANDGKDQAELGTLQAKKEVEQANALLQEKDKQLQEKDWLLVQYEQAFPEQKNWLIEKTLRKFSSSSRVTYQIQERSKTLDAIDPQADPMWFLSTYQMMIRNVLGTSISLPMRPLIKTQTYFRNLKNALKGNSPDVSFHTARILFTQEQKQIATLLPQKEQEVKNNKYILPRSKSIWLYRIARAQQIIAKYAAKVNLAEQALVNPNPMIAKNLAQQATQNQSLN